ncbi:MAG: phenylalanine--tRNA ligase subunit beta, partial [Clostridiales bacterium]|nr:phenylalanine--tRNA ligase subunit beta [Clostridiales bacterium]
LTLGVIGELHPDVMETYDIGTKTWCCELDFSRIAEAANTEHYYSPLPKYPSTSRDISMLVDEDVTVASMKDIILNNGSGLLEKVELFDIYRGKQVPEGKKSASFTLTYRAPDRTLTDSQVAEVHESILKALNAELNAVLRDS